MKRSILLAMIASAALLMVSAGSVAEASHWNRGHSRAHIHYGHNGFRGNYRPNFRSNYGGHYGPVHRHHYTPYRSGNRYGNSYNRGYNYGNGGYIGSNGAGLYFRF